MARVPFGRREVSAQFHRRATRTVARRIALNPPAFLERPRIHRVEAELVEQARDGGLGPSIVAGDDQRAAVLRARRLAVGGELRGIDMVECLDYLRGRQVSLQTLYPFTTASRPIWLPMCPAPISPMVVMAISIEPRRRRPDKVVSDRRQRSITELTRASPAAVKAANRNAVTNASTIAPWIAMRSDGLAEGGTSVFANIVGWPRHPSRPHT